MSVLRSTWVEQVPPTYVLTLGVVLNVGNWQAVSAWASRLAHWPERID